MHVSSQGEQQTLPRREWAFVALSNLNFRYYAVVQ